MVLVLRLSICEGIFMNKETRKRILPMDLRLKEEMILLSKIRTTSRKKMKSDIRKFVKDAKLKYDKEMSVGGEL